MSKNYLKYLFRQYRIPLIFFFCVYALAVMTPGLADLSSGERFDLTLSLDIAFLLSAGACVVLPLFFFSFVHRRKSADVYGALPISRKGQLRATLGFLFLSTFGCYFVMWLLLMIPATHTEFGVLGAGIMTRELFCVAITLLTILILTSGLYLIGNNIFDGVVITAAYYFVPVLILILDHTFFNYLVAGSQDWDQGSQLVSWLSPFTCTQAMDLSRLFENGLPVAREEIAVDWPRILALLVFAGIGVLLLHRNFVRRDLERAEQLSAGKLAYPLIIPLYAVLSLTLILITTQADIATSALLILAIFCAYSIASFVWRRTIRPNAKMLLSFAACFAIAALFTFTGWQTHGFGLGDRPMKWSPGKTIYYSYSAQVKKNDLGKISSGSGFREVTFSFYLPESEQEENEAAQILERFRKKAIREFYGRSYFKFRYPGSSLTFEQPGSTGHYHEYTLVRSALSVQELKTISKYARVFVTRYDNEGNEYRIPLKKYLKKYY